MLLTMKHFMKYKSQLAMYVHSIILYVRIAIHRYSCIIVYLVNIILRIYQMFKVHVQHYLHCVY